MPNVQDFDKRQIFDPLDPAYQNREPQGLSILPRPFDPKTPPPTGMGLFGPLIGQISRNYTQEEVMPYFQNLMNDIRGKFPNAFEQSFQQNPNIYQLVDSFPTPNMTPNNSGIASQNASYDKMSNTFGGIGSLIGNSVTM